jgi:hypothetical protein
MNFLLSGAHLSGVGRAGLCKLFGLMNIAPPIDEDHYTELDRNLLPFVDQASNESMSTAAEAAIKVSDSFITFIIHPKCFLMLSHGRVISERFRVPVQRIWQWVGMGRGKNVGLQVFMEYQQLYHQISRPKLLMQYVVQKNVKSVKELWASKSPTKKNTKK